MSGKGDTPRPGDGQRYREEYDRIFGKRPYVLPQSITRHVVKEPGPRVIADCYFVWAFEQGRTDDNP